MCSCRNKGPPRKYTCISHALTFFLRADGGERGGEEDDEEGDDDDDDDGPAPDDGVFEAGRAACLVGVEPDVWKKICFARKAHPIGGRRRRILRVADDARCCCC